MVVFPSQIPSQEPSLQLSLEKVPSWMAPDGLIIKKKPERLSL